MRKGLEDTFLLFRWNTDAGILDLELQQHVTVGRRFRGDLQPDRAHLREFQSVGREENFAGYAIPFVLKERVA